MSDDGSTLRVRPLDPVDGAWVEELVRERWGDAFVVVHGETYRPAELPGFCAESAGRRLGLVTLRLSDSSCEVVTLDSLEEGRGVGRALLEAARAEALSRGCVRLWLVTTNDNLRALGFYQRCGFQLSALRPGAVDASRKVKPSIPAIGENGIPLRDEIELEMNLG